MPDLDVRALRDRLGMERPKFAAAYGIPVRTLQDWEQDRRQPDATARAYLAVIAADPEAVRTARTKAEAMPVPARTAAPPHPARLLTAQEQRPAPSGVRIRMPKVEPEPSTDERARALLDRIARDRGEGDRRVRIRL